MPCGLRISDDARLRLLDEADAEELHALIEANRAHLARWLRWARDQRFAETVEFICRSRAQLAGNEGFQAAVVLGGSIVGVIGYQGLDWRDRSTRIGYWLDEGQQGRGTMTAAVRLLVEHALAVWRLDRVEIRAAVENRRSRAIPERLGFRREATLPQAELVDGRLLDCIEYAILGADWRGGQSRALRGSWP